MNIQFIYAYNVPDIFLQLFPIHDFCSLFLPTHFCPPFWAFVATVFVLTLTPVPHLLEQDDHPLHFDNLQFTERK